MLCTIRYTCIPYLQFLTNQFHILLSASSQQVKKVEVVIFTGLSFRFARTKHQDIISYRLASLNPDNASSSLLWNFYGSSWCNTKRHPQQPVSSPRRPTKGCSISPRLIRLIARTRFCGRTYSS